MHYERELPVTESAEFVVCGGGFAGFATAVSAAREGADVLLIERNGCLGGNGTAGGVNHLLGAKRFADDGTLHKSISGLFDELSDRLIASGHAVDPETVDPAHNPHGWLPSLGEGVVFDDEYMKLTLEQFCAEASVRILYYTDLIDAQTADTRLKNVIVHNKSGLFAVSGNLFADTTGDADLAALCGCPVLFGRDNDHLTTPASLEMHVENVDTTQLQAYIEENNEPRFRRLITDLREKGIWTFPYEIFISVQLNEPSVYMINTIRQLGVNGTDGRSLTDAVLNGRKENFALFEVMKAYFPGFRHARLRTIAQSVGIRETRRIDGRFRLTVQDLVEDTPFPDCIACSSYGWDLADPKRPSYQPPHAARRSEVTRIPYRCLLPQHIENLICAGRCVSVEREVLGPIRTMAPCMAMGQAAGTAAALALRGSCNFSEVDISVLQTHLHSAGAILL